MMTLEMILLLLIYVAVLFPALITSDYSPIHIFKTSGTYLGSRLEKDMTIGREFKNKGQVQEWLKR